METVRFDSNKVWLASADDRDALYAKFLVSDFSTNLNHVRISRDHIDEWIATLRDQPLVGKIVMHADGSHDFTGHNARLVKRTAEDGSEYDDIEFDTSAFGTFTDVGIEEIDGNECIVATAKVWRRFHDAVAIIERRCASGDLHTSWEIGVDQASVEIEDGHPVKVIEAGHFIGHCLLGQNVLPAYPCSGLLDVAEVDEDQALLHAIVRETMMSEENIDMHNDPEMNPTPIAQPETGDPRPEVEVSALTMWDLQRRIGEAARTKFKQWCYISFWFPEEHTVWAKFDCCESELDYMMFTYEVTADEEIVIGECVPVTLTVSVSAFNDTTAQLNETIAQLNADNKALKEDNVTLSQYRQEREEAERIAAVAELRQYVADSGLFTDEEMAGEELSALIENQNRARINEMISERVVAGMRKNKQETATVRVKQPEIILPPEDKVNNVDILRKFLHR